MVDSLVSIAVDSLNKILQNEVALLRGVTREVEWLREKFTRLQAMLEDAEGRRVKDKAVRDWLGKLKDLAYEVDDILDEWQTEALRSQADEGDGSCFSLKQASSFLSPLTCFNHIILRHKIGSQIKEAKQRLDDIATETIELGLSVRAQQSMDNEIRNLQTRNRETSSLVDESRIVGRDDDVKEVMGLLMGESSGEVHEVPTVVSVVGMGGLGKTTLAQLLYNDEKVQQHFEMRMWVCVSEDFDVKRVTKSIIESAESRCNSVDLDPMQRRLREMVCRERFLLVLDDVWSEESEKWEQLKVPLQAGAAGSRVIITTRSEKVASRMGSTHVHKLPALSENDCWLLFSRTALGHRNVEERSELEKIGREIVKKCGGLPLATKTIGSVMLTKRTKREWELVLENEIWSSPDVSQGGILPALLLSYYDLPSELKQCFAYCSIFPKDYNINKDKLIKLWMAQGFIHSKESGGVEEIGEQYIDELLRRSLLQDVSLDFNGNMWSFQMHDLVQDLAQFIARGECSLLHNGKMDVDLSKVRHAFSSLGHADELAEDASNLTNFGTLYKAKKLRTAFFNRPVPAVLFPNLFHHLRLLRALHLANRNIKKLPKEVGKLRHLRYLDLSFSEIVELPETIADLYNLQSLILNSCRLLCKLPERLRKLINLRHLDLRWTYELKCMPRGIGRLTALHSLPKFIVGDDKKGSRIGELKNLNHLRELGIEGLENVEDMEEARGAELDKKQHLSYLYLTFGGEEKVNGMLERLLRPHSNLKLLEIIGYHGSTLPRWMEDPSFSNLVQIRLYFCRKCKQLPCLGKLPSLKSLTIWRLEEVRRVGVEFYQDDNSGSNNGGGVSFPKLEELYFGRMKNWEEWELRGEVYMMPSLLTLDIVGCAKLKALPDNLPLRLERLTLEGNSPSFFDAKLQVFPNLKYLRIISCDGIMSIPGGWLGGLKALIELEISRCHELESLPEEMQHLTMLKKLTIRRCPRLEERCKVGGEDWHKIAHIPNVELEF